jgi:hypothetical protein
MVLLGSGPDDSLEDDMPRPSATKSPIPAVLLSVDEKGVAGVMDVAFRNLDARPVPMRLEVVLP